MNIFEQNKYVADMLKIDYDTLKRKFKLVDLYGMQSTIQSVIYTLNYNSKLLKEKDKEISELKRNQVRYVVPVKRVKRKKARTRF